jgi:hypothetical protein
MTTTQSDTSSSTTSPDVRKAWLSMILVPFAFIGTFFIGEGLISLLGYPVGEVTVPPFWAVVVASVPAMALFAVPALLATIFARRAAAAGDSRGWVPAVVLWAVTGGFVVLNVGQYLIALVLGLE